MPRDKASTAETLTEMAAKSEPSEGEPTDVEALVREKVELEEKLRVSQGRVAELEHPPKPPEPTLPSRRIFVAPAHRNEKVLVKPGKVITRVNPGSPMDTDVRRDGDVWARFQEGILVTEDPDVVAWCEARPDFCRDARNPQTRAWAVMVEAQMETSTQESRIPKSVDIGRLLEGDISALAPGSSIVDRALAQAGG